MERCWAEVMGLIWRLPLHAPLWQAFKKQGVEQYNPVGEKFNPNMHSALFEVPDASKEPGIVAVVTKVRVCVCKLGFAEWSSTSVTVVHSS
jgi:hypothetical protein